MKRLLFTVFAASFVSPTMAADRTVKPLVDLRLRWEGVDQDGLAGEADAVTFRARTGAEVAAGEVRLGQGVAQAFGRPSTFPLQSH